MQIVVIGGLHHNTLGVIRSLGEEKISKGDIYVLLIGNRIQKKNIISTSKYVMKQNLVYINSYLEIVPWLLDNATDDKKCVICCADGASEQVIDNYELLKDHYFCPSTVKDIEKLMQKDYQDLVAIKAGFYVPESSVVSTKGKVIWESFPCITKPLKSVMGGGKADIHISNNRAELDEALSKIDSEVVQIQKYIEKKMEYQLIGCSLNGGDIIIIPGFSNIIRQPDNTNTGYLIYSPISKLDFDRTAVQKFIRDIGYSGLFSLEFIRGKDDIDYFLEINMRNDGNAYCVKSAGINLPYIWCYYQLHGVLPSINTNIDKAVYFMPEFTDIKRGVQTVGFCKWTKQFFQAKSHAIFNIKDPGPFCFMAINEVKIRLLNKL